MHELHMAFASLSSEIKTGFLPLTDGVLRFPRRGASLQIGGTAGGGSGGGGGGDFLVKAAVEDGRGLM